MPADTVSISPSAPSMLSVRRLSGPVSTEKSEREKSITRPFASPCAPERLIPTATSRTPIVIPSIPISAADVASASSAMRVLVGAKLKLSMPLSLDSATMLSTTPASPITTATERQSAPDGKAAPCNWVQPVPPSVESQIPPLLPFAVATKVRPSGDADTDVQSRLILISRQPQPSWSG